VDLAVAGSNPVGHPTLGLSLWQARSCAVSLNVPRGATKQSVPPEPAPKMNHAGTILHIEDDPNDVLLLEHACRKMGLGCNIKRLADGEEAIQYLEGAGDFADRDRFPLPELILLDIKMPRATGFDVLTWRREHEEFKTVPVIVLSSSNHELDVKRAYDLGVNSYLMKPVSFDSLCDLIKAVCEYWLTVNIGGSLCARTFQIRNHQPG
jgi:CheY-like chemotaxis protein